MANSTNVPKGSVPRSSGANTFFYSQPISIDAEQDYGVEADLFASVTGSINAASAVLALGDHAFTAADVGKQVKVLGACAAGAPLMTHIESVAGGKATLAAAASTTVANANTLSSGQATRRRFSNSLSH